MKPIVLTEEAKQNALEIFKQMLNNVEADGDLKINITTETLLVEQGITKPTVFVTATAYLKMITLINSSDQELAWYGTVNRAMNNYVIEDIFVYPQTVTSSTVDADEEKCAKWFMSLSDETINKLCFQGHSHVTMSASPSGRDTSNWQKFANLLKPGEFYILCIGNKQGEFYWNIYDTACNVHFENKDITMCVIDEKGNSIKAWATEEIEKNIVKETPVVKDRIGFNTSFQRSYEKQMGDTLVVNALDKVPDEWKSVIDYDPDADLYYTDSAALPGFYYNNIWGCYTMSGTRFRDRYGDSVKPNVKKKAGRPKKENKNK